MRNPRFILDSRQLYEITCRLSQGRFLFRPSRQFNKIFLGVLGRAQDLYGLKIFAYAVLSNHYHLVVQPEEASKLAAFMRFLNTNISKEINRLYRFYGPKFQRRYTATPISDEPVIQVARLRYILSQGAKEGLVDSPLDWPGVHCARALITGKSDVGTWYDRTRESSAKKQKVKPDLGEIETDYEVKLSPIPCWRHCDPEEYQARVEELIRDIEDETRAHHRENRTRSLGVKKILQADPLTTTENTERSNAPPIHVWSRELRKFYFEAFQTFLVAYRNAADRLQAGILNTTFPEGCFPPPLPYVRAGGLPG